MGAPARAGTICPSPPRLLVLTKTNPAFGSKDTPPQFPPPMVPGNRSEGLVPIGVYGPRFTSLSNHSPQKRSASGVRLVTSSRFMVIPPTAAAFSGNPPLDHDPSPRT